MAGRWSTPGKKPLSRLLTTPHGNAVNHRAAACMRSPIRKDSIRRVKTSMNKMSKDNGLKPKNERSFVTALSGDSSGNASLDDEYLSLEHSR